MKRFLTLFFIPCHFLANGQLINFDNFDGIHIVDYHAYIVIDTVNYPSNKWQVGKPMKPVFTSAISIPNAIVTDTFNSIPSNDTSVFLLHIPMTTTSNHYPLSSMAFSYKLDVAPGLTATLEVSNDGGLHWINTTDSMPDFCYWFSAAPDFSISTASAYQMMGFDHNWGDTAGIMLLKFTLISDTMTTAMDGWLIDDINIGYWYPDVVSECPKPELISLYPNPSNGVIHIRLNSAFPQTTIICITNIIGQEVYKTENVPLDGFLHLSLPDGIYILKYFSGEEYRTKKIIIAN